MQDDRELIGASFNPGSPLSRELKWKQEADGEITLTELARFADEYRVEGSYDDHLFLQPEQMQAAVVVLEAHAASLSIPASPHPPLRTLLAQMYREARISQLEEVHGWLAETQISHEWLHLPWHDDPQFPGPSLLVQNANNELLRVLEKNISDEVQQALQLGSAQERSTFLRGKTYSFGTFQRGWYSFSSLLLHLASNGAICFQFCYDFREGVEHEGFSREASWSDACLTIPGTYFEDALKTLAHHQEKNVAEEKELFLLELIGSSPLFFSRPPESYQGLTTIYRWLSRTALPCILSRHKGRPFVWY